MIVKIRRHAGTVARLAKPSLVPAFIAATVVFAGGYLFEQQNRENFGNELKINVQNELNLISTRLQGEINTNIAALRGLANSVSVTPDMSVEYFDRLAAKTMLQNPPMVRVSVAPDAVVKMTYPLQGNERMIGTDFKRFGSSRLATDRAKSKAKPIIAGPVRLPSGKTGFNLFFPVFSRIDGHPGFWGFLEAIVDEKELYVNASLIDRPDGAGESTDGHRQIDLQLAIRDISVHDNIQDPFLVIPKFSGRRPLSANCNFPAVSGNWRQSRPKAGSRNRAIPAVCALPSWLPQP
ncbi:CHASE domain-containing protein [Rhizobium sp. 32-5/1]|uniref:CHASE domain-containing protein n=1 Tax=Rhizobium sp. 32-5/1 TaxID=3019602 RepID=UPI00240CE9E5|nr:CHASE domain-containing protein [Rhizobium sp. 32-5/1]WEZ84162.1 CHASE domain-containing protein [Rhizobium sp. 32-5/1]